MFCFAATPTSRKPGTSTAGHQRRRVRLRDRRQSRRWVGPRPWPESPGGAVTAARYRIKTEPRRQPHQRQAAGRRRTRVHEHPAIEDIAEFPIARASAKKPTAWWSYARRSQKGVSSGSSTRPLLLLHHQRPRAAWPQIVFLGQRPLQPGEPDRATQERCQGACASRWTISSATGPTWSWPRWPGPSRPGGRRCCTARATGANTSPWSSAASLASRHPPPRHRRPPRPQHHRSASSATTPSLRQVLQRLAHHRTHPPTADPERRPQHRQPGVQRDDRAARPTRTPKPHPIRRSTHSAARARPISHAANRTTRHPKTPISAPPLPSKAEHAYFRTRSLCLRVPGRRLPRSRSAADGDRSTGDGEQHVDTVQPGS